MSGASEPRACRQLDCCSELQYPVRHAPDRLVFTAARLLCTPRVKLGHSCVTVGIQPQCCSPVRRILCLGEHAVPHLQCA